MQEKRQALPMAAALKNDGGRAVPYLAVACSENAGLCELAEGLPERPRMRALNLKEVVASPYFFS